MTPAGVAENLSSQSTDGLQSGAVTDTQKGIQGYITNCRFSSHALAQPRSVAVSTARFELITFQCISVFLFQSLDFPELGRPDTSVKPAKTIWKSLRASTVKRWTRH